MNILIHSSEAGFSTYIESIACTLQHKGHQIKLDLKSKALNFFKNFREDHFDRPDLIITGFDDVNVDLTASFLKKYPGAPSVGILDSWKGIERFWNKRGAKRLLTDIILVPDTLCFNYLNRKGLFPGKIFVAGHPLKKEFQSLSRGNDKALSKIKLPSHYNRNLPNLIFFSEPLRHEDGSRESLVLTKTHDNIRLIEELESRYLKEYNLMIKLHPLEEVSPPENWIDLNELDIKQALSLSDHTIGLASTTLVYSTWAGIRTSSVDELIRDWKPELSDIPSALWPTLIGSGLFQNELSRLNPNINLDESDDVEDFEKFFEKVLV